MAHPLDGRKCLGCRMYLESKYRIVVVETVNGPAYYHFGCAKAAGQLADAKDAHRP